MASWSGGGRRTSPLRIVLLGGRNSGKSSVGNVLLGNNDFPTKERTSCSRRLGQVGGRWLLVVDAPGWWCDFRARDSSEMVKREIVSSVSLCSPGPHAFLITVKASSGFTERRRRAVEEHVGLLGEGAWSHCMVVFTSDTQGEEPAPTGGEALGWLAGRCGRRCHSITFGDDAQVTALLEKIQKLVAEKGNGAFEMRDSIFQMAAEEKRGVEERAERRCRRTRRRRALLRERLRHVTNIRILLVGAKGSGKTSTLNTILGRKDGPQEGRTAQCVGVKGVAFGRQLTAVDTPGWWMNYFRHETPAFDRREMLFGLSLCPPGPHVFLLVIRLDRAFTEVHRRAVEEHLAPFGQRVWSRVVVLFSFGDRLGGATPEEWIESEGEPLRRLVRRCGDRYHVLNNRTRGDGFQVRELIGKMEETLVGCGDSWHFEMEGKALEQMEAEMRGEKERAEERAREKEKRRHRARSRLEKLGALPEMRVVLVGGRRTGKSSCGNTVLRSACFDTETPTARCAERRVKASGKTVAVLDTPGGFSVTPDLLAPSTALLLVVNASSSFTQGHREALEEQLEAGGGWAWSRAVVLFSCGDWLGDTGIERRIEAEGRPLAGLVDRCGNRYHVLDNKRRGDGAQVGELVKLVEETLGGERMAVRRGGGHVWRSVSSAGRWRPDGVTMIGGELKVLRGRISNDLTDSSISAAQGNGGQAVTLRVGRRARPGRPVLDGGGAASCLTLGFSGRQRLRWTVHLPVCFSFDDLPPEQRLFPGGSPEQLLVPPQTRRRALEGDGLIGLKSLLHPALLHPALGERTTRRPGRAGGLQALIDQWGHRSMQELEDFIDSYFENVWEETTAWFHSTEPERPATDQRPIWEEAGQEDVLTSIDRKLSKLELLEEIRRELAELRRSLEHGWKTIQEKNKIII
ncbi:GTPase IMAP family member 8-like [Brachionichthys hirsutus]|uniref:GTPase IMAP family member 8-like n=1 Tax=Brachionichthys hirsutus TaxID=412623 RepID=UPI0036044725